MSWLTSQIGELVEELRPSKHPVKFVEKNDSKVSLVC